MVSLSIKEGVLELISTRPHISPKVAEKLNELKPKKVLFIYNGTSRVMYDWQKEILIVSLAVNSVNSRRLRDTYGNKIYSKS